MATRSRTSSNRSRSSASSDSSQQFMVLGGVGVAVVVVLMVMMSGDDKQSGTGGTPPAASTAPATAPVSAPASTPIASSARAGKTPTVPPPSLSPATLDKARELEAKMKAFYNEGVTARTAGDNSLAREKQAAAKQVYDEIEKLLASALRWQEEAEMGDWAQPAEYVELAKFFSGVAALNKRVRMGGGK